MQRVRRLVPLALVVVLGIAGLTGCRSNPAVAAYVGGQRYTVQDLDGLLDDTIALTPPEQRQGEINLGSGRQEVLQVLVLDELAAKVVAARGLRVQEITPEITVQMLGLEAGTERADAAGRNDYLRALLRMRSTMETLTQAVDPVTPTEADQREVFDSLVDQGQLAGRKFEQIQVSLTAELLGRHLGLRNVLIDAVERYHVVVNPRYAPLSLPVEIQLGSQMSAYVMISLVKR